MRYIISILISLSIICLSTSIVNGQALEFKWVKGGIGPLQQHTRSLTIDRQQNIIAIGAFKKRITFGSTLINAGGGAGVWMAKFDGNGNVIWGKGATGTDISYKYGSNITTDAANNIIAVGQYHGTVTFDSITLPIGGKQEEGFIAKMDTNGNVLWAKAVIGSWLVYLYEVVVDNAGNYIITGFIGHHVVGGNADFDGTLLTSRGGFDIFIAKYDPDGHLIWVRQAGSANTDSYWERSWDIIADESNNYYITGGFKGKASFGQKTVTSAGDHDIFIAKYDSNGNILWVTRAGGSKRDHAVALSFHSDGALLIAGAFHGSASFDGTTLTSMGDEDAFFAKYDRNGNALWVRQIGGSERDQAMDITSDNQGNILVTGIFQGTALFDSMSATSAAGTYDAYIAKYDSSGNISSLNTGGGADAEDYSVTVAVNSSNEVFIGGLYVGNSTFGDTILPAVESREAYVAKLGLSNSAPVASCKNLTVSADENCAANVTASQVDFNSYDPDGDPLTLSIAPEGSYQLGDTVVTLTISDGIETDSCTAIVTVKDTSPPVLNAKTLPISLWPANHKYVTITAQQCIDSVSDNCAGLSPNDVVISKVTSDEEENAKGGGDGNTLNDMVIANDCKSVDLRAERQGSGNGRVYSIHLLIDDGNGNVSTAIFRVTVAKSKNGNPAIDDGPSGYEVSCSGSQ
ncbi:MAG: hypothetical protein GY940_04165 [bacterium]|nr:hypothetical protein [bacterium]